MPLPQTPATGDSENPSPAPVLCRYVQVPSGLTRAEGRDSDVSLAVSAARAEDDSDSRTGCVQG